MKTKIPFRMNAAFFNSSIKIAGSICLIYLINLLQSCTGRQPSDAQQPAETKASEMIASTPPMGWNSYDCFGATVQEDEVKANAKMIEVHLKDLGWEYVVIDYLWFYPYPGAMHAPLQTNDFQPHFRLDEYGRLFPALDRFPSSTDDEGFKPLADYIHSMGLKFGIHVMRGVPREAVALKLPIENTGLTVDMIANREDTCIWSNSMFGVDTSKAGAQEYYNSVYRLYASWGVDFVKVDDIWRHPDEIAAVRKAIDSCGREMVFSVSAGGRSQLQIGDFLRENANMWRISGDFWDNWEELEQQFELLHLWENYIGPGHWPDADMIPIGMIAHRGPEQRPEHRSYFTMDERQTLFTLWAIARSPLMYGGDLTLVERPELLMMTNKGMIAVNQRSENNRQLFRDGNKVAWIADVPESEDKYLAIFNLGEEKTEIIVNLKDLGIIGECRVQDLWSARGDSGNYSGVFSRSVVPHGSGLFRIIVGK